MVGFRSFEGHVRGQSSGHVFRQSRAEFSTFSAQAEPVPKTSSTPPFGDPQVRVAAAQERVVKSEAALAALHGVDGPDPKSRVCELL